MALVLLWPCAEAAGAIDASEARLEGNRRTQTSYLRSLVADCLDEQGAAGLGTLDTAELRQCLLNSELFSEVRVEADGALAVTVEERWTLIPLPYFRSQEDSTSAGGFVMESNFLGRGQLLLLGATFGDLGNTYFFLLRDPSVASSRWTSQLMYQQEATDTFQYDGEGKVAGFHLKERTASLSPGLRFTPDLEGSLLIGYTDRGYRPAGGFEDPPEGSSFWTAGARGELDMTNYKFYFREGHRIGLNASTRFGRSGGAKEAHSLAFDWNWGQPLFGRSVAKVLVEGVGTTSAVPEDSFMLGGRGSLQGVQDRGLWARAAIGTAVELHVPVAKWSFGTWAGGPFVAGALYRPPEGALDDGWRRSFSYGVGLFFFLEKVAFPGVGFVAGRNEEFAGGFVTAQIGFDF